MREDSCGEGGRDSLKPYGFLEDRVFCICLRRVLQPGSANRPGKSRGEQGRTPDLQLKSSLIRDLGKEIQTCSMQRCEQDTEAPRGQPPLGLKGQKAEMEFEEPRKRNGHLALCCRRGTLTLPEI